MKFKLGGQVVVLVLTIPNLRCLLCFCACKVLKIVILGNGQREVGKSLVSHEVRVC